MLIYLLKYESGFLFRYYGALGFRPVLNIPINSIKKVTARIRNSFNSLKYKIQICKSSMYIHIIINYLCYIMCTVY
jgi:hypothetical protein